MEKLWNSNYKKVMVANFTMQFAFYLLTPLLPLYLSETFGSTKDTYKPWLRFSKQLIGTFTSQ